MRGISNGHIPIPTSPLTPKSGVEKSPFQISANRLEIDESVKRAHLRKHWIDVVWPIYSVSQVPNDWKADRAHYVQLSSGLITIVVMTLFGLHVASRVRLVCLPHALHVCWLDRGHHL